MNRVSTRRPKWSEKRRAAQASLAILGSLTLGCGPGAPVEEARSPKLLLIGIDGVRPDVLAEVPTPNLDRLMARGAFTEETTTTTPSVSGPAWSSMLTGVWPEKHGVRSNDFAAPRYEAFPSFLTRIEQVRPELTTAAVADWMPLMDLEGRDALVGREVDVREALDGYELGWTEADAASVDLSVELLRTGDPDALFVYLGDPDETSHRTGSIGDGYRTAIATADAQVGRLLRAMEDRATYDTEDWLVLVSTDHGRRLDGGHGGDSPEEMTTFLIVSGPGVLEGRLAGPTYIVDVAATALVHLGVEIDPAWELDGRPVGLR